MAIFRIAMATTLSRAEAWSLLTLSAACIGIIVNSFNGDGEPLIASLAFSGLAFAFAFSLIRWLGDVFMKANLKGRDMSKLHDVEMYTTGEFFKTCFYSANGSVTVRRLWGLFAL